MAEESGEDKIEKIESFHDEFVKEFKNELLGLPSVAEAVEARAGNEPFSITLTESEVAILNVRMVWLMRAWIGNLTREVDRLAKQPDQEIASRQDDNGDQ